jgi:hypothetical protein
MRQETWGGSYSLTPDSDSTVAIDSTDGSLVFYLQEVPKPKTVKNRVRI